MRADRVIVPAAELGVELLADRLAQPCRRFTTFGVVIDVRVVAGDESGIEGHNGMIEQPAATKKMVAPGPPIRQLSDMRGLCILGLLAVALGGCGLPAPYQTYAPDQASAAPTPPSAPIIVYGSTTTTPEMVPDAPVLAPAPVTPTPTSAPSSNRVAICYSRLWNKPETIKDAAVQACGGAVTPQITSQGVDIDACPLLTPTKAVFACSATTAR